MSKNFQSFFLFYYDTKYYANDNIFNCELTADNLDDAVNSIGQKVNEIMRTNEFIQEAEVLDKLKAKKACLSYNIWFPIHADEKCDFVVELNSVDEKDIEIFINSIKNLIFLPAEKKSRRCNIL